MAFFRCLPLALGLLRRRKTWLLAALLLPVSILLAGMLLPAKTLDSSLTAGIVLPEDSPAAQTLLELLETSANTEVHFLSASLETARQQVAAGRWACAYVLAEDFESRIFAKDPGVLFTVLCPEGSTGVSLLHESVAAAVFTLRAPGIAAAYAQSAGFASDPDSVRQQTAQGLSPDQRMTIQIQTVSGTPAEPVSHAAVQSLATGATAIFLLLMALLLASDLRRRQRQDWFRRTAAVTGRFPLLSAMAAAAGLLLFVSGAAALLLADAFWGGSFAGILPVACYGAVLTALALVLAVVPELDAALPALAPFVPVCCLLLCPVFFDAAALFPACAPLSRALPPTWLLLALQQGKNGVWMLPVAAALTAAAAGLSRIFANPGLSQ